jgi:HEAT repeat protein
LKLVNEASYQAAASIAFVAPSIAIPRLLELIQDDLGSHNLEDVGPTEAAIFRTPEGTTFVDVLAKSAQPAVVDKKSKDYDTLKWEEELRAQIAKKTNQTKKLTADEQAKVKAQLVKETGIRQRVTKIFEKLSRGVGIIHALVLGPPTETELWFVHAVSILQQAIDDGAGLLLGDEASRVFIDCSRMVTSRLGNTRSFVGIATLRSMGVSQLAPELVEEPLQLLVTRVLYRLRFLSEQRPLDIVSLAYALPLTFSVIHNGDFTKGGDEAEEQLVLALEFISFHLDMFSGQKLPREKLLATLVFAMQKFPQHHKLIKDCLQGLVTAIAPTITSEELDVLLKAAIVPQPEVRMAVLQSIDNDVDLSESAYLQEIWIACHDDVTENAELGRTIWEESGMKCSSESIPALLSHIGSKDRQLRSAASKSIAEAVLNTPNAFHDTIGQLKQLYSDKAKPPKPQVDEYGIPRKSNLEDPWEPRSGVALCFRALVDSFEPTELVSFSRFLISDGPLGDRSNAVRDEMIDAAKSILAKFGQSKLEQLMKEFETVLGSPSGSAESDRVNEAVVILYGALAGHLKAGDSRVPLVVARLLEKLSTPSETVQFAVAECLPALVQASKNKVSDYIQQMIEELESKSYATRRGAAYGLAGIVNGSGVAALREYRIMSTLQGNSEAKGEQNKRQGAFLAYELLSLILGQNFEPYVIKIVPQLLAGFGDPSKEVREACLDAAKTCFSTMSSYGVKMVLPSLLEGLGDERWRIKKGACDFLGAMAYLDPAQLAQRLPDIIPPLANVLNDSHKEVRSAANQSLGRFGDIINNPEIKSVVSILLKALSDPSKHTEEALDALTKIQYVHYLDPPSLALVVKILERGLGDRSPKRRKAAQLIGTLARLTDKRDLMVHIPTLVAGLRMAIVDNIPMTRATASKALGSLVEKLGRESLPDLIPSLMATLKSDVGAVDRLGSAQALSEVLAGLGTTGLEETLPSILQNVASPHATVREGFMSLFMFLPVCFGNSFSNYLGKIIPPILNGLADDIESIRETALRAGRLLVKNFASRAISLILPELERGLSDDSHRIRLSSLQIVGDLLFQLTGITAQVEEEEEVAEPTIDAGATLLEVLGEEKRNNVLSAIYICRCDTSGRVRAAAVLIWKALVPSRRTLKEIVPTLTQMIIRRLASSNMEQKVMAGNALGELVRRAGDGVLSTLVPNLQEALGSTDVDMRQGACMAIRDLILSSTPDALEGYESDITTAVKTALLDSDPDVREAAAEAFDALEGVLGKTAAQDVLTSFLGLLRTEGQAESAMLPLLALLKDQARSKVIWSSLLPILLATPISSFNAKAITSCAGVAGPAIIRRLPITISILIGNIISCKEEDRLADLEEALDSVLLCVDESSGLDSSMSVMLTIAKDADHRKRKAALDRLASFISKTDLDVSRYHPDLVRTFLISYDDSDKEVVTAAINALSELTKRLTKEQMGELVLSTRQVVLQIGVAGANLPGFEAPNGIKAVLPILQQGFASWSVELRVASANTFVAISDRSSVVAFKPFQVQILGVLVRVFSARDIEVKSKFFAGYVQF